MFTICFDTLCDGYTPIMDYAPDDPEQNGVPVSYDTEAEAQAEIDGDPEFYDDCFVCLLSEIGHKAFFNPIDLKGNDHESQ